MPEGLLQGVDKIGEGGVWSFFQSSQDCCKVSTFLDSAAERECILAKVLRWQREGAAQIPQDEISGDWLTKTPPCPRQNREGSYRDLPTNYPKLYSQTSIINSCDWIIHRQILVRNNPLIFLTESFMTVSPSLLILAPAYSVACIPEGNNLSLKTHLGLLNIKGWVNPCVNKLIEQEGAVFSVLTNWGRGLKRGVAERNEWG